MTKYIKIHGIKDATDFVKEASKVDGEVCLRKGRWIVDGSSIMGVMSLDVSTGVQVDYPEDAKDFEVFISQFEVEQ